MDVTVDEDGHLMGAFGVALLAAEAAPRSAGAGGGSGAGAEEFDFRALRTFEFATREVECQVREPLRDHLRVPRRNDHRLLGQPLRQRRGERREVAPNQQDAARAGGKDNRFRGKVLRDFRHEFEHRWNSRIRRSALTSGNAGHPDESRRCRRNSEPPMTKISQNLPRSLDLLARPQPSPNWKPGYSVMPPSTNSVVPVT